MRRVAAVSAMALLLAFLPLLPAGATAVAPPTTSERVDGLGEEVGVRTAGAPRRSRPARAPIAFSMVGFEVPDGDVDEVLFRTSVDGERWTRWRHAEAEDLEGPDPGSDEAVAGAPRFTEPAWVGRARYVQTAVSGASPSEVAVHVIDSAGLSRSLVDRAADGLRGLLTAARPAEASAHPNIVTRAGWGADESLRSGEPSYASAVRYGIVHHTAGTNDYTREDAPAIVRGIYRYHTVSRGWSDIGYNALVDRFGTIYEGRFGGLERAVIGAHAAGFNTGSFGLSVMGTLDRGVTDAALAAVVDTLAWKFALHGIDPYGEVTVTSRGGSKYPSGTQVTLKTLIGHLDVGSTACPGDAMYDLLPDVRGWVAQKMASYPPGTFEPEPTPSPSPSPSPTPSPTPTPTGPSFDDTASSPHASSIERIVAAGITSGCAPRRYCPEATVTRGQMASFLARARGLEPVSGQRFSDVPPDHPHAGSINAVVAAGIASGYPDGTYGPGRPLTRAQMAVLLQRALGLELVWGYRFSDVPRDDVKFRPRINAIAEAGVAQGCTADRFCPADPVTRAQMASFLSRALDRGL